MSLCYLFITVCVICPNEYYRMNIIGWYYRMNWSMDEVMDAISESACDCSPG